MGGPCGPRGNTLASERPQKSGWDKCRNALLCGEPLLGKTSLSLSKSPQFPRYLWGRSPTPGDLLVPGIDFLEAYGQIPRVRPPGEGVLWGRAYCSCEAEIHLEGAACLLVQAPGSVSMATQPLLHLSISLPTPRLLFITSPCPRCLFNSSSLGTHLLLSFTSFVILKSKKASL